MPGANRLREHTIFSRLVTRAASEQGMLRRQAQAEFRQNILRIQEMTNDIRMTISLTQETIMGTRDSIRRAEEMLKLWAGVRPIEAAKMPTTADATSLSMRPIALR